MRPRVPSERASVRMLAWEPLEPRQLLSTIHWANRGQFSDRFDATFGANAALARNVVDAAIEAWQRVIDDFHQPGGGNTINVNVSMESSGTGFGATAIVSSQTSGHPTAGSITLERGNDTNSDGVGDGGGYFLDPTPHDHSEFAGSILHAFTGDAQAGSPAVGKADLFTLVTHELTHVLGIIGFASLKIHNPLAGSVFNTQSADDSEGDGAGKYFVFDGPSVTHLMTSNNGGPGGSDAGRIVHSAGPDAGAANQPFTFQSAFRGTVQLVGTQDVVNSVYEFGRRYLPTDYLALMLHDAYGYSVTPPQAFGTFYTMLEETTGELLVRGRTSGGSPDTFHVSRVDQNIRVSVDLGEDAPGSGPSGDASNLAAYVTEFPLSAVTSITVQGAGGSDVLTVDFSGGDPVPAGGISYAGGAGNGDSLIVDLAGTFHATHTGTTSGTVHIADTNKDITYTSADIVQAINGQFTMPASLEIEPSQIAEGESVLLDLQFNPGSGDHTVTIDWGDGGEDIILLPAGVTEIAGLARTYADDMPSGTPSDPYTISVSVTDATQSVVFSDSRTVTVENAPPVIASLILNPGSLSPGGATTLSGTFTDPGSLDTFLLDVDTDGDGLFEVTGVPVSGGAFSFGLTLDELPGTYSLNARLRDDDGGEDSQSAVLTITPPPVELGGLQVTLGGIQGPGAMPIVAEGQAVTLSGTFLASQPQHRVHIDWGDGASDSLLLTGSQFAFLATHTYADDAPGGTSQDANLVTVRVEEDVPGGAMITNNNPGDPLDKVTVLNVAPVLTSLELNPPTVAPGGQATLSGTFTDPGAPDTFQIDVDRDGDGTFELTEISVAGGSFSLDLTFDGPPGTHPVGVRLRDDDGGMTSQNVSITLGGPAGQLQNVLLFYNNSALDANGIGVDANDFAAIAVNKLPLAPGGTATFANVSGYSRGINGLFLDFSDLPADGAGIDAADFAFRLGNDNFPDAWNAAPAPTSIGVMANQGPGGADRVFVTFADGAIRNIWLRITVAASGDTGLLLPEDFFFAAAPGETGAGFLPGVVGVDAADLQAIAEELFQSAGAENPLDLNRDRTINAFDLQVVATNLNFTVVPLITPQLAALGASTAWASAPAPRPLPLEQKFGPSAALPVRNAPVEHRAGQKDAQRESREIAFATFAASLPARPPIVDLLDTCGHRSPSDDLQGYTATLRPWDVDRR